MKKQINANLVAVLLGLVALLTIAPLGCGDSGHIYENDAVIVGGDGNPIDLVNNPSATNPTYALVEAFIKTDTTDTRVYTDDYSCGDFAEDVHNNAEAMGIKAGWVGIFFMGQESGHACNVFQTTDRGLVYIDCTGSKPGEILESPVDSALVRATSWDKVAYIELGREYGVIAIEKADSLLYSYYDDYRQSWQKYEKLVDQYNDEVTRYNEEIEGKVYQQGSAELARIKAWEAEIEAIKTELDSMAGELGDFRFEPLGIVEDFDIHW